MVSVWYRPHSAGGRALCVLAASLAIAGLAAADAQARPERTGKRFFHKHAHKTKPVAEKAEKKVKRVYGPLLAVVSLRKQRISVYGSEGLIAQSVVSTGQSGFPTPTGVFSVIQKNRFHRSNIYSGAPMPFMQRITWSGVALHAGVVPGYPASHGCIRLTHSFATELWGMTRLGARVVVSPDDLTAQELEHPALPVPAMTAAPDKVAARGEDALVKTAQATTAVSADGPLETGTAPQRPLSPLERAQAAKARTAAEATAKAKAAKEAVRLASLRTAEANKAIAALHKAELAAATARARVEGAERAVENAKTPEAVDRAKTMQADAQTALGEAEKVLDHAAREENVKTFEAFEAARAAWDAEEASTEAAVAKEAAERSLEPISILISRKAGKIYIRRAWAPIYEAPVTFKEPELPLGTHLYLATAQQEDGRALRWLGVSMPPSPPGAETRQRGRRDEGPAASPMTTASLAPVTAAQALDRVELSPDARAFIEDKLWTGAALIVSDQGISNETGKYTDFIVLTR